LAVEIEIKLQPPDIDALRRRLIERGARARGRFLEVNTILDTPDGRLRAADQGLRVRLERRLSEPASQDRPTERATLTWKGPRTPGAFKSREELETPVGDADAAVTLLASLGFVPRVVFEKRREQWDFAGCSVCIDELPGLPTFVEIEGAVESMVQEARDHLGLAAAPPVAETYVGLAAQRGKREADGTIALRFSASIG
jgi:adenylate cyclase class 2